MSKIKHMATTVGIVLLAVVIFPFWLVASIIAGKDVFDFFKEKK